MYGAGRAKYHDANIYCWRFTMYKKGLRILACALAVMVLGSVMVWSQGQAEPAGDKAVSAAKIGVSLFYRRDEFYKDLESGFIEGAEKYGYEINIQDADADPGRQTQQLEDFIAIGVDVIAFACSDPDGLIPAVEEANKADIPVFTFDGGVNGGEVVSFVGMDNFAAGKIAGEWARDYILAELNGKANVVILDFPQSAVVCGDRVSGFRSVIEPMQNVQIVAQQDGKASRTESMNVMENILTANSKIDVVFGINDDTIFGGVAACEAAGRDEMVFVSVGWSQELFNKLANDDPYVKASAVQNPYQMAINTIEAINKHLNGETLPAEILQDAVLVTKANVGDIGWEEIVAKRK